MQMMRRLGGGLAAALLAGAASSASGQSINVDIGDPGTGPSDAYAAAGLAGAWNAIPAAHGDSHFDLLDLEGNPTSVWVKQIGGTQNVATDDPATTGDDELLMDDYLVTFSAGLETCLFFHNLQPGTYEVLLYAWMPDAPETLAYTNCDQEAGNPHLTIGGAWPGGHVEGITYARHVAEVTAGDLYLHSGIVPGEDPALGAACNGVQLRLLVDCPADLDGDGVVGAADLAVLLGAWGTIGADLDGDQTTGAADLAVLLGAWGEC